MKWQELGYFTTALPLKDKARKDACANAIQQEDGASAVFTVHTIQNNLWHACLHENVKRNIRLQHPEWVLLHSYPRTLP